MIDLPDCPLCGVEATLGKTLHTGESEVWLIPHRHKICEVWFTDKCYQGAEKEYIELVSLLRNGIAVKECEEKYIRAQHTGSQWSKSTWTTYKGIYVDKSSLTLYGVVQKVEK